jgi:hypothetical protein
MWTLVYPYYPKWKSFINNILKMEKQKKKKKEQYVAPKIWTEIIEMEYGIAVSSANVQPTNSAGEISQEWQVGTDRTKNLDW